MSKRVPAVDVLLLKHHLTALGLPTVKAECEQAARECARANVDHLGFLLRLCERELADRSRRATQRRIKAARFPQVKSLDDFDFTAQPSLSRALVLELARCDYLERREAVILVGNPGTGKTQGKRPANHVLDELSTLQRSPGSRSSGGLPCPKLLRSRQKPRARPARAPLPGSSGSNA